MEDLDCLHQAGTEPIPGYRLLQPLGRGGFGEVWKCEAPGGLLKAIKFVHGGTHHLDDSAPAEEELRAIERVKAIRHPFMLSMERVESLGGELAIVMELADKNLSELLKARKQAGYDGLPREDLLTYLEEAAEVLDVINARHGLQHLDIKPQNLFLVSNHVKVGDFGLVSSLTASKGDQVLSAITPLYASPEVFQGSISPHSDQYSLAIVYQELLTGTLPFAGKNSRQLLMAHVTTEPNLSSLPEVDRPIVAKALSKDPLERFPSCSDFIRALATGQSEIVTAKTVFLPTRTETDHLSKDTRNVGVVKPIRTERIARPPGSGSIGGLDLVSRTPLSEIWRGRNEDGSYRIVKVLFGCPSPNDPQVARLGQLNHPVLLPIKILQHAPGRLVLSSLQGDRTLRDVLILHQNQGEIGIPRAKLIEWLRVAAEGLSYLHHTYGLQHLGLNTRAMQLFEERLMLEDFGIAQLVWRPAGQPLVQLNGRYSAPELAQNVIGPAADQYSLALIYHELLTGVLPPRKSDGFVLDRLPKKDRDIIDRALKFDPEKRWPTILDLVTELEKIPESEITRRLKLKTYSEIRQPSTLTHDLPSLERSQSQEDCSKIMRTRFETSLSADVIHQRIEAFGLQWQAQPVKSELWGVVYQMLSPRSLWQQWTGQHPSLEIQIQIRRSNSSSLSTAKPINEVQMDLRPRECTQEQTHQFLKIIGPLLVESMRTHLQASKNGRAQERLPWHYPLILSSTFADGSSGPDVGCQGKDISLNGIGFYLPGQLPTSRVTLQLPETPLTPKTSISARIIRVQGCGDGWYEVGAVLLPPDELPAEDEPDSTA